MDCFGIFAKYWEPGQVKTRLAAALGSEAASEVYRHFVSTLVRRFRHCADRRVLCFTPPEQVAAFAGLAGADWIVQPQAAGDLGWRMASFFDGCFQDGADRVVLIGSDSPTVPDQYVASAFRLLRETEVVLGPTRDGGYYLVGASRPVTGIFDGIDWSTPHVWQQTIAKLAKMRLSYKSLPRWYDVDEQADLIRLRDELSQSQLPCDDAPFRELLAMLSRHPLV